VNQLVPISLPAVPALVVAGGERASMRFLEFYLKNGGTLEKAVMATMPRRARHSSTIAGATRSASRRSSGL